MIDIAKERALNAQVLGEIVGVPIHTSTPNPPAPPLGYLTEADPFLSHGEAFDDIVGSWRLHLVSAYSPDEAVMIAELDSMIGKILANPQLADYLGDISAYYPVYGTDQQTYFETQISLKIPVTEKGQ